MKKIIFPAIIVFHGLIHFIGFAKAYGLGEINQLTGAISKPIGLVWLFTGLLLVIVGALIFLGKQWVWIPAAMAALLSQTLITLSWQDAKFGTIANLMLLLFAIFSYAAWNFNYQIEKEAQSLLSQVKDKASKIVDEAMLAALPSPIQRWLKHAGVVGKPVIQSAYLVQKGQMKLQPNQKSWAPAQVVQYVTTDLPGFLWKVQMKIAPFVNVAGRDKFQQGKAEMMIKIGSLFPVVNLKNNEKTNQSTMQRFLMELPWYPSAAISSYINWEEIDDNTAKATMNYQGITGSATFSFNQSGDFLKVRALRYKDSDEQAGLVECIGEAKAYREVNGIRIPTKMNVTWLLDEGPFTWYTLEVLKASFK